MNHSAALRGAGGVGGEGRGGESGERRAESFSSSSVGGSGATKRRSGPGEPENGPEQSGTAALCPIAPEFSPGHREGTDGRRSAPPGAPPPRTASQRSVRSGEQRMGTMPSTPPGRAPQGHGLHRAAGPGAALPPFPSPFFLSSAKMEGRPRAAELCPLPAPRCGRPLRSPHPPRPQPPPGPAPHPPGFAATAPTAPEHRGRIPRPHPHRAAALGHHHPPPRLPQSRIPHPRPPRARIPHPARSPQPYRAQLGVGAPARRGRSPWRGAVQGAGPFRAVPRRAAPAPPGPRGRNLGAPRPGPAPAGTDGVGWDGAEMLRPTSLLRAPLPVLRPILSPAFAHLHPFSFSPKCRFSQPRSPLPASPGAGPQRV